MRTEVEKAFGKLNLSLDIVGRRGDGYHLLRMVMQTVNISDTVYIERTAGYDIEVTSDSGKLPSGPSNLAWRAADIMRRRYGLRDGFRIHIEKRIPVAAGMAGGSADAAAVFRLMRRFYEPDLTDAVLEELALPLGADIPYCISGGTKLCEGVGEVLTPLPAPPSCSLVVVKPDCDVSTAEAYHAFDSIPADEIRHPDVDAQVLALRRGDLAGMCRCCGNVLEQKTGEALPVIGELEQFLMEQGALVSRMTGSGSTVFAVFGDRQKADTAFEKMKAVPAYDGFMKFRTEFTSF